MNKDINFNLVETYDPSNDFRTLKLDMEKIDLGNYAPPTEPIKSATSDDVIDDTIIMLKTEKEEVLFYDTLKEPIIDTLVKIIRLYLFY